MTNDLYVAVVGHIKRKDMAENLAATVEADELFMDDGMLGEWGNHERALRKAAKSGKKYVVVLQDDAVPVEEFRKVALEAAEQRPRSLISLYTGTHRPRKEEVLRAVRLADKQHASWLTADTLMWGVGILLPAALVEEILNTVSKSKLPYDQRIGLWAELTGNLVHYTWPSLVDHADQPTVISGRSKQQGVRVAHKVGVPEWGGVTVHIQRPQATFLQSNKDQTA